MLMDVMTAFDKTKNSGDTHHRRSPGTCQRGKTRSLRTRFAPLWIFAGSASRSCLLEALKPPCVGCSAARRSHSTIGLRLSHFSFLEKEFVTAMVEKVTSIARNPLALADALAAFDELKQTPLFFRLYLDRYLTNPFEGAQGALNFTKEHVFNNMGFEKNNGTTCCRPTRSCWQ
ncbi:hypothetical protein ACFS07_28475 [Undibacterium arcticum]